MSADPPAVVELGIHELGLERARVVFNPNWRGAAFQGMPDDKGLPIITIGFDPQWFHCVASAVHEAFELAADRRGCRFTRSGDVGRDNADYTFVMNHAEYAHCCACAGDFVATVAPALEPHWKAEKARRDALERPPTLDTVLHADQ